MKKILNLFRACLSAAMLFSAAHAAAEPVPPFSLVVPAGLGAQEGNAVAVDTNGHIYLTGQFQGNATIAGVGLTNAGLQDYFFASFDSAGNPRWAFGAGTTNSDYGTSVKVAANGDLIISAGIFMPATFHGTNLTGFGGRDAVIARFSSQGTLLWARVIGGSANDEADEVSIDSVGNIVLSGRINGVVTIGTNTIGTAARMRQFLAKFTADGVPVWASAVTTQTAAAGSGVAIDGDNNILVTGQDIISGQDYVMVSKYNPNGQKLWSTNHLANGSSLGTGIRADSQNNIYVCGTFSGTSITFGSTTLSNVNFALRGFVAKYNPSGQPLWASRVGGRAYRLAVQRDGTTYTCGFFLGSSGNFDSTTLTALGSQDGFITKHDSLGQLAWAKQAGSSSGDILRNITQDGGGRVFVSGEGGAEAFGLPAFSIPGKVAVARLDTSNVPPGPVISLSRSGNQLILSWPAEETNFVLNTSGDLNQPFSDAQVTLTPVSGQTNVFTTPLPSSNLFFRLKNP